MSEVFQVIGHSISKVDAPGKVAGQTRYAGDLTLPRMLHCKILRSTQPYAQIQSIDANEARKLPGVLAVLCGRDLPKKYGILGASEDETALAVDKVRFVGDPVAAVAAVDEACAAAALKAIRVVYNPLPPVMTLTAALQPSTSEPLHAYAEQGNIQKLVALEFGDTIEGFAQADHIQDDLFFYGGNTHLALEEHATLAHYDPAGKLTVWSSTQSPHYLHRALARYFELAPSHVQIVAQPTGGGFGGKTEAFHHDLIVAKFAMLTGRPVKIVLTREEVFYLHRGRHPVLMRFKTGVKQDGTITAMTFEALLDGGAYGSYGLVSTYYTGVMQTLTYNIPVYQFQAARIFTNKPPCGPKRGQGGPQPRFGLEIQMDKIAEALAISPLDLRLRNLTKPYTKTANHLSITTTSLRQCLEVVAERSQFRHKHRLLPSGQGVGLAASGFITGTYQAIYPHKMPHVSVQILVDRGGGVTIFSGTTDIGQGSNTILAMIVAEALGIGVADIQVVNGDTQVTPPDMGSFASRVTFAMGHAAIGAAQKIQQRLTTTAAELFTLPAADFVFANQRVFSRTDASKQIAFVDLVKIAEAKAGTLTAVGSYTPQAPPLTYRGGAVGQSPVYSFTACVAAVQVDVESGVYEVEKVWVAHDVGKALNPRLVEGQIEGCVYMAVGEVMMEEEGFRRGLVKAPSILDYKIPTFLEMPAIDITLIENFEPSGPYGAKEAAQGPQLPIAPAIANAIYDAVGVRIDETPITAEKVFKALTAKAKGKAARVGPKQMPIIAYPKSVQVASHWGEPVKKPTGL